MAFPQYQGGSSFLVFSAQGSNPTANCKISGKSVHKSAGFSSSVKLSTPCSFSEVGANGCKKNENLSCQHIPDECCSRMVHFHLLTIVYEKSVKGYVYSCSGGMSSKIQFPKDETKAGLQLIQPYLVLQIFIPKGQHFSLELRATDTQNTRRKMYFSTSFNELKSTPLHCQIPLTMVLRNTWISLALHVSDLFQSTFRVLSFRSLDVIILGPVCKLRKIFTMRNRLAQSVIDAKEDEEFLPPEHAFAPGIDAVIQVVDTEKLQNLIGLSSNGDGNRDIGSAPARVGPRRSYPNKHVNVAFGSRMPLPLSTVRINASLPHDSKTDNAVSDITRAMELPRCKAAESASRPLSQNRSILTSVAENKSEVRTLNSNPIEPQVVLNKEDFTVQEEAYVDADEAGFDAITKCPDLMSKHGQKIQKLSRRREEKIRRQHRNSQKESSSNSRANNARSIETNESPPGSPPTGWDNNSNDFLFERKFNAGVSEFASSDDLPDNFKAIDDQFIFERSFNTSFQNDCALDNKDSVHLNPLAHSIQSGILSPVAVTANTSRKSSCSEEVADQVEDFLKTNSNKARETISEPVQNYFKASQSIEVGSCGEENWDVHEEMDLTETLCDVEKDNDDSAAIGVAMSKSGRKEMFDRHSTAADPMQSMRPLNGKNVEIGSTYNQQNQQASLPRDTSMNENKCNSPADMHALLNYKKDEELDLLYDPILACYYDPKTNRYYELK